MFTFNKLWIPLSILSCCLMNSGPAVCSGIKETKTISSEILGLLPIDAAHSSIVYGYDDEWAGSQLYRDLSVSLRGVKLIQAQGTKPRSDDLVIYVGSFGSNPLSKIAFKSLGLSLQWEKIPPGGYLLKTVRRKGRTTVFLTGVDLQGTLSAVQETRRFFLHHDQNQFFINDMTYVSYPLFKDRRVWLGEESPGNSGPLPSSDGMATRIDRLKRELDEAGVLRFNEAYLAGGWPESQEGIDQFDQLRAYAATRGIRIIPALQLSDGRPARSDSWPLSGMPGAAPLAQDARAPSGGVRTSLCLARETDRLFVLGQLRWLLARPQVDHLHFLFNAPRPCSCGECQSARARMKPGPPDFLKELFRWVNFLSPEINRLKAGCVLSAAFSRGYGAPELTLPTVSREGDIDWEKLPEKFIMEWDLTSMVDQHQWPSPFKAPAPRNIGLWRVNSVGLSYAFPFLYHWFEEVFEQARSDNLAGLSFSGPLLEDSPWAIISRLAFSEFAFFPNRNVPGAWRNKLAHYFGGLSSAKILIRLLQELEKGTELNPEKLETANELGQKGLEASSPEGKVQWKQIMADLRQLNPTTRLAP
jgi:hypothetical protein